MKILVIGSWRPKEANEYLAEARELGHLLAERGHILVASPSSGFQGLVAKAYKNSYGLHYVGYYPRLAFMEKVGEKALIEPDKKIFTNQDYPTRNLLQIKKSDAVIGVTGGLGTLTELIAAVKDYDLPASFYSGSSEIIDGFLDINPDFARKVMTGKNIALLIDSLEGKA
jgi:predicted Rossmann-fold nucleotide-binding protein